jgi:hypothetical protein
MRTLLAARTVVVATVAVTVGLVAGCAAGPQPDQQARPAASALTTVALPPGASPVTGRESIFGMAFNGPSLTFTGGSLYLTWQPPVQPYPPHVTLSRVDAATGVILASNTLSPGILSAPLYAAGWLWMTDAPASVGDLLLLRLDPRTLMVTGELNAGIHSLSSTGTGGHVAFAGGSIWVDGGGQLVRVSPRTVTAELAIPQPGADSADLAASPGGGTLIVTEADSGNGAIQRRDPVTGALLASHPMLGVVAPLIGGVSNAGAWVREPTGMLGYVERFATHSMSPQAETRVEGSNGISADVWDGALWVRNQAGGPAQNYCADPATGRRLATLPLPDLAQDYVLTVHARTLYYSAPDGDGVVIRKVPVPAACG